MNKFCRGVVAIAALSTVGVGAVGFARHAAAAPSHATPSGGRGAQASSSAVAQRLLDNRLTLLGDARPALAVRDEADIGATPAHQLPGARAAWQAFQVARPSWTALWDHATGVPSQIWGPGIMVPGAVADGAIAAAAARSFLRDHLAILAPGADMGDFVLVANQLDDGIRTVGFEQYAHGLRVIGGQMGVRFLADRLYLVSSQALPNVVAATTGAAASLRRIPSNVANSADVASTARAALQAALGVAIDAPAPAIAPPVAEILPIVTRSGVAAFHVVVATELASDTLGPFVVYSDLQTGKALAGRRLGIAGQGTLVYDAVTRYPGSARYDAPATGTSIQVNGQATTTTVTGTFSWSGTAAAMVTTGLVGGEVKIKNAAGDEAVAELSVSNGGIARWSAALTEQVDAQLQAYVHAHEVKAYARQVFPGAGFIDRQLLVRVNLDSQCNAYSDGTNIHFYRASETCENTARLADVVYHEYGHVMHHESLIQGVGSFDGALSEGIADVVAADMTGDSGMGRGFYFTDAPLRELNPDDDEQRWPEDIGEIHYTGMIFGGAMWDLRVALYAKLGPIQGGVVFRRLFKAAIMRSYGIPSTFMEVLAADDDNGDLTDGTPNECEIRAAFGRHGLRFVAADFLAPGAVIANAGQTTLPLSVGLLGLSATCPGDQIDNVELKWKPLSAGAPPAGASLATQSDGRWSALLPMPADGKAQAYQFIVHFLDGTTTTLPNNPASPYYQMYQGELIRLYCTDFEDDPFAAGWTLGEEDVDGSWAWGSPTGGDRASGDPTAAYSGAKILGTALGGDGLYAPKARMTVTSPLIEVAPYSDVRIQYRRWLNVEDGYYDQARIAVNGIQIWENANSDNGESSSIHHQDHEWMFHDIRLSGFTADPVVQIEFSLTTDEGLNLGGWNIDDFCVVADAWAVCGDGEINGAEQCDDGDANADAADTCRSNCRRPVCGDGIRDAAEQCDDGARVSGDGCSQNCEIEYNKGGSGCQATGQGRAGSSGADQCPLLPLGLGVVALAWLWARRRRG